LVRDRSTVDGYKRFVGTIAVLNNGSRYEFFPAATFATNQDGDVLRGNSTDGFLDFDHSFRATNESL
jgi:hypothetical protein